MPSNDDLYRLDIDLKPIQDVIRRMEKLRADADAIASAKAENEALRGAIAEKEARKKALRARSKAVAARGRKEGRFLDDNVEKFVRSKLVAPMIAIMSGTESLRRVLRNAGAVMKGEKGFEEAVKEIIILSVPELFREMGSLLKDFTEELIRRDRRNVAQEQELIRANKDVFRRLREDPRVKFSAASALDRLQRRKDARERLERKARMQRY